MISRISLLKCREGVSEDAFRDGMTGAVQDVIAAMPDLRKCEINFVTDRQQRSHLGRGAIDIDGYSELHFDTYSEMLEGVRSLDAETGNALLDDAEVLLQKRLCDILVCSRTVVREVPSCMRGKNLIHHVSFLNRAAGMFVGTHDFAAVRSVGTETKSTVRTIYYCDVTRNGDLLELKVCANGFLYNMVRAITGTVLYAAEGKFTPEDIPGILERGDRTAAGPTVPPGGLYLTRLWYEDERLNG